MSEDNLGSGLYLDQTLDLSVNTTGDIQTVSGSKELQKDLSFQLLILLKGYTGQPLTPEVRSEIKDTTIDALLSDSRVDSVNRGAIAVQRVGQSSIKLEVLLTALGGSQEFVFTI